MAATPVQVDALYTTVEMRAGQFLEQSDLVIGKFRAVTASATQFAENLTATMRAVETSVEAAAGRIGLAVEGVAAVIGNVSKAAADLGVVAPATIASSVSAMERAGVGAASTLGELGASATAAGATVTAAAAGMSASLEGTNAAATAVSAGIASSLDKITGAAGVGGATLGKFSAGLSRLTDSDDALRRVSASLAEMGQAVQSITSLSESLGAFRENMTSITAGVRELVSSSRGLSLAANSLAKLNSVFEDFSFAKDAISGAGAEIKLLAAGLTKLPLSLEGMTPALVKRLGTVAEELGKAGVAIGELTNVGSLKKFGEEISALAKRSKSIESLGTALSGFGGGLGNVAPTLQAAEQSVVGLGTALAGQATLAADLALLSAPLESFSLAMARMVGLGAALPTLNTGLQTFFGNMGQVAPAASALARIGTFLEGVTNVDPNKIPTIAEPLRRFSVAFVSNVGDMANADVARATLAFSRVGGFLDAVRKFNVSGMDATVVAHAIGTFHAQLQALGQIDVTSSTNALRSVSGFLNAVTKFNGGNAATAQKAVTDTIGGLINIGTGADPARVEMMSRSIQKTTSFLKMVDRVNVGNLQNISVPVVTLFQNMAAIDADATRPVINSLNRYVGALSRASRIDPAKLRDSVGVVRTVLTQLGSIPVNANVERVADIMSRLGRSMRNMAAGGGAGGPPGISISAGGGGFPRTAREATRSTDDFGRSLRSLASVAGVSDTALRSLRFTMAGFSVVGIALFAKLDDGLRRVMAHMGDFDQEHRGTLSAGIQAISGASTTGNTALTKSLDTLTSSGMSAAMAVKSLAISESFAVAGGMEAQKATKHLVDIMAGMNLFDPSRTEANYESMRKISDLIVGTAAKSGSTEDQLASAFSGRFMTALRQTNTTLEDGITLLSIYSRAGGDAFRGPSGGNAAAKALQGVLKVAADTPNFKEVVPDAFVSGTLKMKPMVEVLGAIASRLAAVTDPKQREALLEMMGFDAKKMIPDLYPIIEGMGKFKELRAEVAGLGGVSEKVANMMRGSIIAQLKNLWNNVSNAAIVFGDRLAPALSVVSAAISDLMRGFTGLHPAIQSLIVFGGLGVSTLPTVAWAIGRIASSLAGLVVSPFVLLVRTLGLLGTVALAPIRLITGAFSLLHSGVSGVVSVVTSLGAGIVSLVTSVVTGFLPFLGTLLMWAVAAIPLFALVATAGLTISAVYTAVTGVVGDLWYATKQGAANALDYGISKADALRGGFVATWDAAKSGATEFFDKAVEGFKRVAGFFWNFQENLRTITAWLKVNWRDALLDIGTVTAFVIGNVGTNFMTLMATLKLIAIDAFRSIWAALSAFASPALGWLKENWTNILADMGTMFRAFGLSLIHNLSVMLDIAKQKLSGALGMDEVTRAQMRVNEHAKESQRLPKFITEGEAWKSNTEKFAADLAKAKAAQAEMIEAKLADMKGPEEFLSKVKTKPEWFRDVDGVMRTRPRSLVTDWKTKWGDLGKAMGTAPDLMSKAVGPIFSNMAGTMVESLNELKSPWQENIKYLADWGKLMKELNTELPNAEVGDLVEKLTRPFNKAMEPGELGEGVSKSNAGGGSFKQISLERTMVNGPVAESLDYQQLITLKSIDAGIYKLINARGAEGGNMPNWPAWSSVGP